MANVKDLLVNGSARVIGTIYGNATSANKLNTNAGSASQPVYFSNGIPVAITGSLSNNAASATKLLNARNFKIGNTSKSFNGTADVTWTHAEIGATVSNTWTGGTIAGPTLSTTVNGITGTSVAIPSASASASGVITTGDQTFAGLKTFNNGLRIGNNANGDTNYIAFYGTTGDNPGGFNHTYIGENLWGSSESSELVLFKGNDIAPTASTVSASGPDRIRHIAAGHLFQVYTSALSGSFTTICDSTVPINKFEINQSGAKVYGNLTVTDTMIGNASTATKATQDASGNILTTSYLRRYDWWDSGNGNNVDNLRAGTTFAYTNHNAPVHGTIVAFDCRNNEGYTLQLMGHYSGNHLYFRNKNGDNSTWGAWRTVLDDSNYNSYVPSKTGSGASGTWGISITGNANTATALTTSAGSATQPIYFSNGKPVAITGNIANNTTGNAATATKWSTPRTLSLDSDASGSTLIDGSSNIILNVTNNKMKNFNFMDGQSPWVWYTSKVTYTNSSTPSSDWYVKVILNATWISEFTPLQINADYSNKAGKLLFILDGLGSYWSGYLTSYVGSNILAIRRAQNSTSYKTEIFIKLAKPIEYSGTTPNGNITVYSPYTIESITPITAEEAGSLYELKGGQNSNTPIKTSGGFYGNATSAAKLQTARTIALTGSVTGSGSFDGSGNLSITTTTNHTHSYLPLSGGTLTGSVTFANGTYNVVGDDASFGDINNAGTLAIQGKNGNTNIWLVHHGQSWSTSANHATISYDGTNINIDKTIVGNLSGNASTATKLGTATVGGTTTPIYLNGGVPTALGYTIAKSVPSNAVFTDTTYYAGTGLSLSGTTFNHKNSVTAATAQGDASKTLTFGGTFTIPTVTYDAQGHITAKGTTTMTMPANPNTWRGIQNNLTSDSTTDSLSAAQGKALKALVDGKAASGHTHGLSHTSLFTVIANTTTDTGWNMLDEGMSSTSSHNFALLKSLRFQGSSPAWGVGDYGAGIAFGGADTKGVLSVRYGSPQLRIAGGNGSKPVWYFGISGSSGVIYDLNNFWKKGDAITGAVWNDYAEYRKSTELEPGRCVIEVGDGSLIRSFGRLEPGAEIVSDTFGFAIGETDECKTPLAVSGRVLAYPAEDRESYKPGDAVCSGPNGTVSKMTRQEIREWPDRIIGTVSEIPNYETWGTGNVSVNGRIWIRIR